MTTKHLTALAIATLFSTAAMAQETKVIKLTHPGRQIMA